MSYMMRFLFGMMDRGVSANQVLTLILVLRLDSFGGAIPAEDGSNRSLILTAVLTGMVDPVYPTGSLSDFG